eukprot:6579999-Karenia_brevis.AAC.1
MDAEDAAPVDSIGGAAFDHGGESGGEHVTSFSSFLDKHESGGEHVTSFNSFLNKRAEEGDGREGSLCQDIGGAC